MSTALKRKVSSQEISRLAGDLNYLKTMVEIERKVCGEDSYRVISRTMEEAIRESCDVADRLLFADIGEAEKIYECIACGTTFKEVDGEHKNGYLVCPSCWCEDLREISE